MLFHKKITCLFSQPNYNDNEGEVKKLSLLVEGLYE